jgi:hypothetical protein
MLQRGKATADRRFAAAIAARGGRPSPRSTSRSASCVVAYVLMGLLGGTEVYEAVDWRVIVLLGSSDPARPRAGGDRAARS